ncbi:NTP transferase domain-containing protein [Helicobacter suis]|uniref:NTP transferase domain-containing protein n=1 Tax=Helicobacter suis TaxID=104628 RepID=UPI0013D0E659|nr:NTP transferase domain-containing protein [Helicobacter suis]
MEKIEIACVILTGGKSARMQVQGKQQDKALLPFGTYPSLLAYQHAKMAHLFNQVYISAKKPYALQANYILDERIDLFSPLLGVYSALKMLKQSIFILPVDMPLVKEETILKLCNNANKAGVIYAKSAQTFYLIGCWQPSMLEVLQHLQINTPMYQILTQGLALEVEEGLEFSNCNTYTDYQNALAHVKDSHDR